MNQSTHCTEMAALLDERNGLRTALIGILKQATKHIYTFGQGHGALTFARDPATAQAFDVAYAAVGWHGSCPCEIPQTEPSHSKEDRP